MTKKTTSIEQLEKLTDALVEDILKLSDKEVLLEAKEQFSDPSEKCNHIRDAMHKTILHASKNKFSEAKSQLHSYKKEDKRNNVISFSHKKSVIENFTSKNFNLKQKLTLAARKGEGIQTENDIDGMFEDLLELGMIDEEGNPK